VRCAMKFLNNVELTNKRKLFIILLVRQQDLYYILYIIILNKAFGYVK